MLRTIQLFSLLILVTGATLYGTQAIAQEVNPTGLDRWDSTNEVLFYGDGSPGSLVRAYVGVRQRLADIDIFKDFAGIREVYVDSLTAGPDGTTSIAAILNFGDHKVQALVLTYDSSGRLLKTWDPAPQYVRQIAYSDDDGAVFVLGDRDVPDGPNAPDYPLLVEYNRDGRVLKNMIPASTLKDAGDSFNQSGETGQPMLRVTKDHIYFYAPTNREAVMCDRNGVVLAYRSISDIVDKISTEDGYHLAQIHNVDFSEDGDIVLELLLGNSNSLDFMLELVRINIKTGEAAPVHKTFKNGRRLWFIGLKDGQYLYLADGKSLYIQSAEAQEPVPLDSKRID